MMRGLAIIGAVAFLSACGESVESNHPLFTPGPDSFKPGIWGAVPIDQSCELPKNTAIFVWPDCAGPLLIKNGTATYFTPAHVGVSFMIADGNPRIVQADKDIIGGWTDSSDRPVAPNPGRRFYASFYPDPGTPFTAGRIQFLTCPAEEAEDTIAVPVGQHRSNSPNKQRKPIAGLRHVKIGDHPHCIADTPEAVRELARRASPSDGSMRIVWIGSEE